MNERYLLTLVDNTRHAFEDEIQHETPYKLEAAMSTRPLVDELVSGSSDWPTFFKAAREFLSHHLGWRAAADLGALGADRPDALRSAVARLVDSRDSDQYYEELRMAGVDIQDYRSIRGPGAKTSVASFFLFVKNPTEAPIYRAMNIGVPLRKVVGSKVRAGSPREVLDDYYSKLDGVKDALRSAGVPVRHRLDVQGLLWIANYKKWFDDPQRPTA